MEIRKFTTSGGFSGECREYMIDPAIALDSVWAAIDERKGGLFVSNYEVPDRYARWDTGFVDPPLELVARGRRFEVNALNGEGRRLLTLFAPILRAHPHVVELEETLERLSGATALPPAFFAEETRSRQPSLFSVLRALLGAVHCTAPALGLYGAFGFDLVFQFEQLTPRHPRDGTLPDCVLFFPTDIYVVDRQKEVGTRYVYDFQTPLGPSREGGTGGATHPSPPRLPPGPVHSDHTPAEFQAKVQTIREGCRRGDYFEVVLSQSFSMPYGGRASDLFRRICANNPSPYSFLINMGAEQLVGASPEMFVRVGGRRMETSPISGTVPVGGSAMETAAHIKALIGSEKEESELTMCTDVDRNDMTRVCVPGSVELIGRRLIETYSRLVHTVDHVVGELAPGYDALDAFVTHLWACTVSGSPKPMALQTIEDLEAGPRRWYAGAIGYLSANGDLNTGMTLRTVHLEGGQAKVRAGATLLYDSDPETEERETRIKAAAFLEATLGETRPRRAPGGAGRTHHAGRGRRVLFVDFLDSFVHTLASYVRIAGADVTTVRQGFPDEFLEELRPELIFLSPGPGTPAERGVHGIVRRALARQIPLFGVCLGHQGIAEVLGGSLGVLETPVHGKPSRIAHHGQGLFAGIPDGFNAARYHSLYVVPETLPPELEVTAHSDDGVIMALAHRSLPIASVQFHPESILTLEEEIGQRLIENLFTHFLDVHRPRAGSTA
ncbi:MAG: anthranilate synthase component I [Candidatus Lambdaproteobacteria bacterium]|nr:anthranilate synthase component I [Candidatus Lambdaproteobacteria bacterium]